MKRLTPNPKYYGIIKRGLTPPRWLDKEVGYPNLDCIPKRFIARKSDPNFEFREGQREVVDEALKHNVAMIVAPTGFGKSIIAMNLCKGKTIILCHSLELIISFQETLERYGKDVGIYCSHKKEIDKEIIIVHHNTFCEQHKEILNRNTPETIIIDECHRFFSEKHQQTLNKMAQLYKPTIYGFTATPNVEKYDELRPIGNEILNDVYMNTIYAKYDESSIPLKKVYYTEYNNPKYMHTDETLGFEINLLPTEWMLYKKAMVEDEIRSQKIVDFIKANTNENDHTVVLMDRLEEISKISESFEGASIINSKIAKNKRKKAVEAMKENPGILFGQIQAAGTGLDIPKCNKVFIICSTKSKNTTVQAVGRATRLLKGKESEIYIFGDRAIKSHYKMQLRHIYEKYPHIAQVELAI